MKRFFALLALIVAAALPAPAFASDLTDRLEILAARSNGEALYHLGMIYHLGLEGVAQDRRRALDYFRRSAEAGDPLGAYKLGCYYAGQGGDVIVRDAAQALRYKLIAAEAGYVLAQMEVGQIYADRDDAERALHWFDAAARQGDWAGLFMAFIRVMPDGRHPDRARAWLYYKVMERTLAGLPEDALSPEERLQMRASQADMRRLVETGMTPAERAEGERLLAEWRIVRSPINDQAQSGLNAARRLVGLPDAA